MKNCRQEIFTKVYRHLMKQQCKSMNGGGNCRYRTNSGLKCAVGCLISDKKYTPLFEGWTVRNTFVQRAIPKRYTPYTDLLGDLQRIHDLEYVEDWKFELEALATRNNLKIPKLVK